MPRLAALVLALSALALSGCIGEPMPACMLFQEHGDCVGPCVHPSCPDDMLPVCASESEYLGVGCDADGNPTCADPNADLRCVERE